MEEILDMELNGYFRISYIEEVTENILFVGETFRSLVAKRPEFLSIESNEMTIRSRGDGTWEITRNED